jgi:hypothetical protein
VAVRLHPAGQARRHGLYRGAKSQGLAAAGRLTLSRLSPVTSSVSYLPSLSMASSIFAPSMPAVPQIPRRGTTTV